MPDTYDDAQMQALVDAFRESDDIKTETQPRGPSLSLPYRGVTIASRFNVLAEFDHMRRAVDAMADAMLRRIESIWCDSKAGRDFSVGARPGGFVPELPDAVAAAFQAAGGHDGIAVYGAEGQFEDVKPSAQRPRRLVA